MAADNPFQDRLDSLQIKCEYQESNVLSHIGPGRTDRSGSENSGEEPAGQRRNFRAMGITTQREPKRIIPMGAPLRCGCALLCLTMAFISALGAPFGSASAATKTSFRQPPRLRGVTVIRGSETRGMSVTLPQPATVFRGKAARRSIRISGGAPPLAGIVLTRDDVANYERPTLTSFRSSCSRSASASPSRSPIFPGSRGHDLRP